MNNTVHSVNVFDYLFAPYKCHARNKHTIAYVKIINTKTKKKEINKPFYHAFESNNTSS